MRRGTWTETGSGRGGGGAGVGLAALVGVGLWLAAAGEPASTAPTAAGGAPPASAAPVREAAAHAAQGGHGVGWWALVAAGALLAVAVLTVAGLVLYDRAARRRVRTRAVDTAREVSTAQDTPIGGDRSVSGGQVVHLADYAGRDRDRGRKVGGGESA